ncbi:MAG TPA: glycerophosphodiester phosphodiesterase [Candidatus Limnocylindrales bacterium]|nr:glycerophosphodiester phosphodiesterase [Candidatus Limnocylindrales bacterium]
MAAVVSAPGGRALRLAHRGDWRRGPENTIAAFLAALAVPGCDGLEFDVRAARDGVAVCYHDETLARVHGVDRRVADLPADELEALGVPTLEGALNAIPRRAFLDVELKGDPGRGAFEALVAGRGAGLQRAVVSSFEPAALERIGGYAPRWPRWLNASDASARTISTALELGCRGISVEWHALERRSIGAARAAGLEVAAWTVRRRPSFDRLARLGVVAICAEAAALDGDAGPAATR